MTLLLASTLGFFSWSAFRRLRQVKVGVPDPRFEWSGEQIADRAKTLLIYAFGQKKMPNYTLAGFAHVGIFIAFQVLLLNSLMLWGRGFDPSFDFWGLSAPTIGSASCTRSPRRWPRSPPSSARSRSSTCAG
jgi:hypothetical protein